MLPIPPLFRHGPARRPTRPGRAAPLPCPRSKTLQGRATAARWQGHERPRPSTPAPTPSCPLPRAATSTAACPAMDTDAEDRRHTLGTLAAPSIRTRDAATHIASSVSCRSPPFPDRAAALFLCSFPSRRRPCSALDSAATAMPPFPSLLLLRRGMDETEQPPTITTAPPLERRRRTPQIPRPRAPVPRHQPQPRPRPAARTPQRCRAPSVPCDAKDRRAELRLRPRQEPRRHLFGTTKPTPKPQTSVPASSDPASSTSAHSPAPSQPRRLRRPA